jgi:hypothetical protein
MGEGQPSARIAELVGHKRRETRSRVCYLIPNDQAADEAERLERDYKRVLGESYWHAPSSVDKDKTVFEMIVATREELQGG